jgi:RNA recognition motif-containing protein
MPHNELFLGGLSKDARRQDLEDVFSRYGKITRCDIKYVNGYAGTAYGFIGFEDERDAEVIIEFFFIFKNFLFISNFGCYNQLMENFPIF